MAVNQDHGQANIARTPEVIIRVVADIQNLFSGTPGFLYGMLKYCRVRLLHADQT